MPISAGVVGIGNRGAYRARSLGANPNVTLEGVSDADSRRAGEVARQNGCRVFSSTLDLFEACDTIFVSVPTCDHFLVAREATRLGKDVFLEWPPATSIDEVASLVRISHEAGSTLSVSAPLLHHPAWETWNPATPPSILQFDFSYRNSQHQDIHWPHEIADCLTIILKAAGSLAIRKLDARAARSTGAIIHTVAFTAQLEKGTLIQVLLHRSDAPSRRVLTLADRNETTSLSFDIREDAPTSSSPETTPSVESLLEAEQEAFMFSTVPTPGGTLSIADSLVIVQQIERILAKLR